MEEGLPDSSNSAYAEEGSSAHFLASEVLLSGRTVESYRHFGIVCWEKDGRDGQCFYGEPLPEGAVEKSTWKIDSEMVEHITAYVEYVRDQVKGGALLVEQRVSFGSLIGVPGAFGTSDTIILSANGEELIIIDLKYGYREVSAERNSQMCLYALGALHTELEDPDDLTGGYLDVSRVKTVKMAIFQPRLQSEPDCPEWSCDLETLYAFANAAKASIAECEQAAADSEMLDDKYSAQQWVNTYLHPSEKACMWCKAKAVCPAIAQECLSGVLMPLATDDGLFDLDAEPTNAVCVTETENLAEGVQQAIAKIPTLSFDVINSLFAAKGLFKSWSEAIEARMLTEMLNGAQSSDFKLVNGRGGHRKWADDIEVEAVMKAARLKVDDMYDKKLISPANAEKLLKKKPKVWKKVMPLITRSEGAPVIAQMSDKRPAINPNEEALLGLPDLGAEFDETDFNDLI